MALLMIDLEAILQVFFLLQSTLIMQRF